MAVPQDPLPLVCGTCTAGTCTVCARRRLLRGLAGGVLGLALAPQGWTTPLAGRELRALTTGDSPASRQLLQALRQRYPALVSDTDVAALDARKGSGVYVAVGPVALQHALASDLKGPLISVLTSSQVYRQLVAQASSPGHEHGPVTAVYADAAPLTQMQLTAAIFDSRVTVGVLLSEASAYLDKPLRQAAAQVGLDLVLAYVAPDTDVVRSLTRLRGAQVLLAVPDATLYGPDTMRAILESTYRRSMPVIGFSAATVAAGTLASAYPHMDDMAADLGDLLDGLGLPGSQPLPEPRHPRYWRVAVNERVARSLGVVITDKVLDMGNSPTGRSA